MVNLLIYYSFVSTLTKILRIYNERTAFWWKENQPYYYHKSTGISQTYYILNKKTENIFIHISDKEALQKNWKFCKINVLDSNFCKAVLPGPYRDLSLTFLDYTLTKMKELSNLRVISVFPSRSQFEMSWN